MISGSDLAGGSTIAIRQDASGRAVIGGGRFDLSEFAPGTPAFWTLAVLILLVVAICVVTGSML